MFTIYRYDYVYVMCQISIAWSFLRQYLLPVVLELFSRAIGFQFDIRDRPTNSWPGGAGGPLGAQGRSQELPRENHPEISQSLIFNGEWNKPLIQNWWPGAIYQNFWPRSVANTHVIHLIQNPAQSCQQTMEDINNHNMSILKSPTILQQVLFFPSRLCWWLIFLIVLMWLSHIITLLFLGRWHVYSDIFRCFFMGV